MCAEGEDHTKVWGRQNSTESGAIFYRETESRCIIAYAFIIIYHIYICLLVVLTQIKYSWSVLCMFGFGHIALSAGTVVPTCLAPETVFIDSFSMEPGRGRFRW